MQQYFINLAKSLKQNKEEPFLGQQKSYPSFPSLSQRAVLQKENYYYWFWKKTNAHYQKVLYLKNRGGDRIFSQCGQQQQMQLIQVLSIRCAAFDLSTLAINLLDTHFPPNSVLCLLFTCNSFCMIRNSSQGLSREIKWNSSGKKVM